MEDFKIKKGLVALFLAAVATFSLFATACKSVETPASDAHVDKADYIDFDDYKRYLKRDLVTVFNAIGSVSTEVDAKVVAAKAAAESDIDEATGMKEALAAYRLGAEAMVAVVPNAEGAYNYSGLTATQKTEILGKVEAFAIRNGMLGITLFENGGYVMYNPRITLGTQNYIVGYGFGTLAEGAITADLESESKAEWKRYYHTYDTANPGTINFLNDQGSQVGDLYSYMGASYYTNFMNETKDGYIWVPELAVGDPEPVGELDANGQNDTWRFEIRKGLKYNTNSKMADRAAFNGREVAMEDFITPYKFLLNQANGLYRGGEAANQTGASAIKGAKAYYEATANAQKGVDETVDFSGVGIKLVEEGDKTYFQYTLGAPVTLFYARYYISSSLYMPVPKEFIELVGVDNYLGYNEDKTVTPVDNALSLGSYTLEAWDEQQIVFKKNPHYVFADTKYAVEGVHVAVLTAANEDKEAAIKEFLAGKIDSAGIPDTYLSQYVSDPRTKTTPGDSCFKLNMNALDRETWVKLFGENGSYSQTTPDKYWDVKPVLSNAHFRQGLSYAFNRTAFATIKGSVASVNYFSSNYMSDPENNISYNATKEHKDAIKTLVENTDGYGYDLELARDYFRMAIDELEAEELITPGTKEAPRKIELEVAWMYPSHEEGYHKYAKQYWEDAFNDESITGGLYTLELKFWVGEDYMACYNKILSGQFDLGFGSINGNPLDPLSFFNVNSTDPAISNNFTLNWAIDTGLVNEALVYDGKRWSFDALYQATQQTTIVSDGLLVPAYELSEQKVDKKEDGSYDITLTLSHPAAIESLELEDLVIFGGDDNASYNEWALAEDMYTVEYNAEKRELVIHVILPASEVAKVPVADNQGIDIYFAYSVNGGKSSVYKTAYISFK